MPKLPFTLPAVDRPLAGQSTPTVYNNTGGYDVLIGGHGFRLATDQQFPYTRTTEPTTAHRYDTSLEPGEQSLSPLPWLKSQSTFHAGAGQLNLEAPFTAFQYQQEQVEHDRFDASLNVDCWTPGKVKRLPDVHRYSFGFAATAFCTAVVGGVDYAIVGGAQSLYQVAFLSGPDSTPTITAIDLTSATFGGMSNCTVSSLSTDGTNYYGVLQLTSAGSAPGILTYIISGAVTSAAAPTALYEVPNFSAFPPRVNLCTDPSFEAFPGAWVANGSVTLAQVTTPVGAVFDRTHAMSVTSTATPAIFAGASIPISTVVGKTYTFSFYAFNPTGTGPNHVSIQAFDGGSVNVIGSSTTTTNFQQRVSVTFTAAATTTNLNAIADNTFTSGKVFYIDGVLAEQAGGVGSYFDGATAADSSYIYAWSGTADASTSTATNANTAQQAHGVCGWVKERLIAAVSNSVYELPVNVSAHSALPTAKYTHPIATYMWSAISESPSAILVAGANNGVSTILSFTLDTSGNTPTLGGGATIAQLPPGEKVLCLQAYLASFLAIGTTAGVRVATFDTYTGAMTYGPLSLTTTQPVYAVAGRDRFVYAGYTNQQADGTTGLAALDLSMQVDTAGRVAWAPHLKPPSSAPTGQGTVTAVAVLPGSLRLMFLTSEGIHVEGNGPGSDGLAWLRTSRIRFGTDELKLFKYCRVHGTLDSSQITITGTTPFGGTVNLATVGFVTGADPGPIKMPTGLNNWVQLTFQLQGSSCEFDSYTASAYPAPKRQHITTLTLLCFREEAGKTSDRMIDPQIPWLRYQNLRDLESAGSEITFVEFGTLSGTRSEQVIIDQLSFRSFDRPTIHDDFAGYIDIKLRSTET